jgi:hypothetical protein
MIKKHREQTPDLHRGQVYGCCTIIRTSSPRGYRRRYLVRLSCCGRELTRDHDAVLQARPYCIACRHRVTKQAEVQS